MIILLWCLIIDCYHADPQRLADNNICVIYLFILILRNNNFGNVILLLFEYAILITACFIVVISY